MILLTHGAVNMALKNPTSQNRRKTLLASSIKKQKHFWIMHMANIIKYFSAKHTTRMFE